MSTPNPLAPQGSLLEKQARSKSTLQVAALIVGLHVFGLGGFLILGCKKEEAKAPDTSSAAATNELAAANSPDTNAPISAPLTNALAGAGAGIAAPGGTAGAGHAAADPGAAAGGAGVGSASAGGLGAGAAAPDPGAAPSAGATEYTVQKGDIAFNLAKKHNVTLKALSEANPNVDLKKLKVGAKIQIPAPGEAKPSKAAAATGAAAADSAAGAGAATDAASGDGSVYRVKGGDNLGKIAKKHGVSVKALRAANGLTSDNIRVGQKLKIPAKAGGAAAAAPAAADAGAAAAPAPVAAPVAAPLSPSAAPTGGK
jgi:hypothetical protein